ncbi:alpha-E domain-containing protein [Stappia sp. F7233]|uniref:Alpha-E domain-containing protein n=1 Tax=Stappia albiluteola TaxID=2758565 RepID=A0A839A9C9_9HYPH|nr:alpha-E domain-containing protein [Stappia albiluteola]MBA5775961.1 alpha-E domain-containing protein [Stappia albiluteola]
MLGRTAASLFWTLRYNERAENMARLLEVAYRIAMTPRFGSDAMDDWRSTLVSAGCLDAFEAKGGELSQRAAINFLLFDRDNPSSVRTCVELARNNARSVRTAITSEMWESINTTYIEMMEVKPQHMTDDKLPGFLSWVKQRAMLFRGALLGTLMRNEGYYFSQLGTFVERADNTARILDVKYWILLPDNEVIGGSLDTYQWSTILRSVSANRSYRHAYRDSSLKAFNVAEFLILRKEMPRSLAYCYDWIEESMEDLTDVYRERLPSYDMAVATHKLLTDRKMSEVFQYGLHEFLSDFISRNNGLSLQLSADYNFA